MINQLGMLWDAFISGDPAKRYEGRYRLARTLSYRLGFRIYNPYVNWVSELEPLGVLWTEASHAPQYLSERHYVVYSMAKALANLPGDMAECGVYYGASSFVIGLAMEGTGREHHAFDSFEGLSKPDAVDLAEDKQAYQWQESNLAISLETVSANLKRFDFIRYYPGWIPTRFASVENRQFSFVHIDVDLYQPTRDSLAFFYERVLPGGIILCDDYGSINCPGATQAFDEFLADKPEKNVIQLTTGQGLIVKR